jgi:predicted nucleic acid-binding protein
VRTLLDTNVISELRRPGGSAAVRARVGEADADDLYLSVISIGEIGYGIARLSPGKRKRELEAWLSVTERHFGDRILAVDRDVAQVWGEITARAARAGRTLHAADGLIAATALHHGLRLMTRNTEDFAGTGVLTIDPWAG